jgi:single-stranded-DNA-specific exonuclease
MGRPRKRWVTRAADPAVAGRLAEALRLPGPLGVLLVARGFDDPQKAEAFLNPRLADMSDPARIPGIAEAAALILGAVRSNRKIVVYGDYDADGLTATALMVRVLRHLGARVDAFIPHRVDDGYGLTMDGLSRCLELKPDLLVTVDCGITALDAIREARRQGVTVVVTDHHEPGSSLPDAHAIVDPKLGDDETSHVLAGVGVAFKLCHALIRDVSATNPDRRMDLRPFLELVAIGTVADVVPLTGENRAMVRYGLAQLSSRPSVGMQALLAVAEIKGIIEGHHIGYGLGPRLNAMGRLAGAQTSLRLLLCDDFADAGKLAQVLEEMNIERRRVEDLIRAEAEPMVDPHAHGIVLGREGWHVGAIGIVASRICQKFYRPSVVISFDENGRGKGSCRSVEDIDLLAMLDECHELLESHGGHKAAAGLVIMRGNFEKFSVRFDECCRLRGAGADCVPTLVADAAIGLDAVDMALARAIAGIKPLGAGNPVPLWRINRVRRAAPPRKVGKNGAHLQFQVASGRARCAAVAFNCPDEDIPDGEIDIICQVDVNSFRGVDSVQLNIQDWAASP